MRALDTNIKAEFIKKNNLGSASSQNSLDPGSATYSRPTSSRPNTGVIAQFDGEWPSRREDEKKPVPPPESPKKLRPRSLTFTLSKGDHASKKERADRPASHSRTKSASIVQSASSSSLNAGVSSFASVLLNKAPKQAVPEDFITYFRKVQNPQLVEVGRLQKLRQLLRNETVTWVDSFIALGGVTEIVGLLYRIIDIEWRCVTHIPSIFPPYCKMLTLSQGGTRRHPPPSYPHLPQSPFHHLSRLNLPLLPPLHPLSHSPPPALLLWRRQERPLRILDPWHRHLPPLHLPLHLSPRFPPLSGSHSPLLPPRPRPEGGRSAPRLHRRNVPS